LFKPKLVPIHPVQQPPLKAFETYPCHWTKPLVEDWMLYSGIGMENWNLTIVWRTGGKPSSDSAGPNVPVLLAL
tara:strand:- start:289 stop:510 length:222 start_codon:yes stop_codon:yes gene_type:complete